MRLAGSRPMGRLTTIGKQQRLRASGRPVCGTPLKPGRSLRVAIQATAQPEAKPGGADSKLTGASTDLRVIYQRLGELALPYWTDPEVGSKARWNLAAVVGLTLATTGVSVVFNFLGRDFFNALSEKNEELFTFQLFKYMGAFVVGIPVFVFKSYYQSKLALEWRAWLTNRLMDDYFANRTFYSLQAQATVDNPDQRMASDVAQFTGIALNLSLVMLNALIDLVSFSGILYSIYPPLFGALLAYSVGGTALSIWLGKPLVGLNFAQEAREADLRYGLVRVRENAEAVAFYRGEADEKSLLQERLKAAVSNYLGLLIASRNLDFFTSFYRYLIQLLPAAVVAPLFFQGKIEFGVINQSQSAFNHVLNDLSLVVYQFESLAGFSAVIDRLGQFQEAMDKTKQAPGGAADAVIDTTATPSLTPAAGHTGDGKASGSGVPVWGGISVGYAAAGPGNGALGGNGEAHASTSGGSSSAGTGEPMLSIAGLSVVTPDGRNLLVSDLHLQLAAGGSLLVMGPSGAGKTSILRSVAGLWTCGEGQVHLACPPGGAMFLPQKPYMVLGSLRDQVLYPTYAVAADQATAALIRTESSADEQPPALPEVRTPNGANTKPAAPPDEEVVRVLRLVRLGHLLSRYAPAGGGNALDAQVDWASSLSLGEQQRVAWARLLLARPAIALLDEASSALDQTTEEELYRVLAGSGITYVSVAHRSTLKQFHSTLLQLAPATPHPTPTPVEMEVVSAGDGQTGEAAGATSAATSAPGQASMTWRISALVPEVAATAGSL